jgi:hypothetical protein
MGDPYVREVGQVEELEDAVVYVGVDYDAVSVDLGRALARFTRTQAEEFARIFVAACWEAGANSERMRREQMETGTMIPGPGPSSWREDSADG